MAAESEVKEVLTRALRFLQQEQPGAAELVADAVWLLAKQAAIEVTAKTILPKNVPHCPQCLTRLVDGRCSRCDGCSAPAVCCTSWSTVWRRSQRYSAGSTGSIRCIAGWPAAVTWTARSMA